MFRIPIGLQVTYIILKILGWVGSNNLAKPACKVRAAHDTVISLGNVGLNPPLNTQHNEGVGGCNEGNPNAAIKQLGADRNDGRIFDTAHAWPQRA